MPCVRPLLTLLDPIPRPVGIHRRVVIGLPVLGGRRSVWHHIHGWRLITGRCPCAGSHSPSGALRRGYARSGGSGRSLSMAALSAKLGGRLHRSAAVIAIFAHTFGGIFGSRESPPARPLHHRKEARKVINRKPPGFGRPVANICRPEWGPDPPFNPPTIVRSSYHSATGFILSEHPDSHCQPRSHEQPKAKPDSCAGVDPLRRASPTGS